MLPFRPNTWTLKSKAISNVLRSDIRLGPAFPEDGNVPEPSWGPYTAVWDTGATNTAISRTLAEQIGLLQIGEASVQGVSGVHSAPTYLASVYLPNMIAIPELTMTGADLGANLHMLIGMDLIRHGDFAITNLGGETWFSFRVPSVQRLDFHAVPLPHDSRPCSCASGKLYKNCCKKLILK